jgi:hypothetical protein
MRLPATSLEQGIAREALRLGAAALALALAVPYPLRAQHPAEKGPRVGQAIPPFRAIDQFGRRQSFRTLRGRQGLVLLFFRSADW